MDNIIKTKHYFPDYEAICSYSGGVMSNKPLHGRDYDTIHLLFNSFVRIKHNDGKYYEIELNHRENINVTGNDVRNDNLKLDKIFQSHRRFIALAEKYKYNYKVVPGKDKLCRYQMNDEDFWFIRNLHKDPAAMHLLSERTVHVMSKPVWWENLEHTREFNESYGTDNKFEPPKEVKQNWWEVLEVSEDYNLKDDFADLQIKFRMLLADHWENQPMKLKLIKAWEEMIVFKKSLSL